jgi:AcrR family transcriptional regulator
MDGFKRRKERKRDSIQRAALELFKVYGFKKVSMKDIAHKANVSQVTIYNHFGSKEGLVREAIKTLILYSLGKYRSIIKGGGTFVDKLELIVFDKTELLGQFQGELIQTVIRNDPEIEQFVEDIWQREVNQLVIDLFEEGRRQGYVNQDLSEEAIMAYYDILRRGIFAKFRLVDTEHNAKLMSELMSLFLYGLMGKREQV